MKKRDLKRRDAFRLKEEKHKFLQSMIRNENLSLAARWWSNAYLAKLPRHSSYVRCVKRCVETNRGHSVMSPYGLSRLRFRKLASRGDLPGVKKVDW